MPAQPVLSQNPPVLHGGAGDNRMTKQSDHQIGLWRCPARIGRIGTAARWSAGDRWGGPRPRRRATGARAPRTGGAARRRWPPARAGRGCLFGAVRLRVASAGAGIVYRRTCEGTSWTGDMTLKDLKGKQFTRQKPGAGAAFRTPEVPVALRRACGCRGPG